MTTRYKHGFYTTLRDEYGNYYQTEITTRRNSDGSEIIVRSMTNAWSPLVLSHETIRSINELCAFQSVDETLADRVFNGRKSEEHRRAGAGA